ncbi:Metallo-beta-lactamase superfamily [Rubrobacter radiotolerans]|uniref:MBL fold metallo-hydrolase n=1 Tax=Rubrobacter radiotolerans TaxID=42256 RepID=A0A023X2K7_RUBRA|nr:MBL fold metallo-hydrolase [Rubrobacter radiotolerans]AHY46548.1 Metallo-beta-lactamase superfamily [Rubrobacter radiotolerans]MDX5893956.1 MBL fold metallo-hydrolase [Rubrobacter radiotolerans]SMC04851.1 Metallo-beta-lactamase superfamily protein [Rubrobacter radiotolerans DSM 5868]
MNTDGGAERDAVKLGSGGRLWVLEDGLFITDAGNILGDTGGRNVRIRGAMHALLHEGPDGLTLLDAGFGPEVPVPLEGRYEVRRELSLPEAIEQTGNSPEDVALIVLSHLDPDHVGWAIHSRDETFPNARIVAQRDALEEARRMKEGDGRRLAVPLVEAGIEAGWFGLLDGDEEVASGVSVEVRSGHSEGHQVVWIGEEVLFSADLAPSKIFLEPDLISGVDTDPEAARRNRIEVLSLAERLGAMVALYHEPKNPLVHVAKGRKGFEATPV